MFVVPSLFVVLSVARRKRRPYSGPHLVARLVRGASCALGLRLGRTAPRAPRGTIPAPSALSCAVLCLASRFVSFAFLPSRPSRVRYLFNPASALCCAPPHRPRPRLLACTATGPPNQRRGGLLFFNEALRLSGGGKPPYLGAASPFAASALRRVRTVLSVCPAARPAPGPPLAGPWDAVQMRPWPGPVRSFWFSFSALSFFVRSPPGPRLARSWAARGMPPRCGPGPAPFVPSFFAPQSKTINSRLRFLSAFGMLTKKHTAPSFANGEEVHFTPWRWSWPLTWAVRSSFPPHSKL